MKRQWKVKERQWKVKERQRKVKEWQRKVKEWQWVEQRPPHPRPAALSSSGPHNGAA